MEGWAKADSNSDGVLEQTELLDYIRKRLNCAQVGHPELPPMSPKDFRSSDERFFAYDPTRVRDWKSPLRQLLATELLLAELKNGESTATNSSAFSASAPPPPLPGSTPTVSLADNAQPVSARAVSLAKLIPSDAGPYGRALKLIAEGMPIEATILLKNPDQIKSGDSQELYLALGLAQRYAGQYTAAIQTYKKGLAVNQSNQDLLDETAHVLTIQKKYKDAGKFFERSVEAKVEALGPAHPDVANTLEKYEEVLRESNQVKKANDVAVRVAAIKQKVGPE
jgi:tetratricopeptide (TPR) repeat protein